MNYSKKFRLYNIDGTLNKNGPGYTHDSDSKLIITNIILYHQNIDKIIKKQELLEKKRLNERNNFYIRINF